MSFKRPPPLPSSIWKNPIHFVACGFGVGAIPICPGTMGTIAAIPLAWLLSHLTLSHYIGACILLFFIGVYCCHIANRDFKTNDHPGTVFDEMATFPVALIGIPFTMSTVLAAFILFRVFDILKPGPIGWVDRNVHGGFGVMLDDLMAALATWVIVFVGVLLYAHHQH